MKIILCFLFLLFTVFSYAGTMTVDKKTEKFIQYKDEVVVTGSMIQEAVNCGYKANDVEEVVISKEDWLALKETQMDKPNRELKKQKEEERKQKETALKNKLNLSDKEWKDLKELLSDR